MKRFKVIINGPRKSDPSSVFCLTKAEVKGFSYNDGDLCIDYNEINSIIEDSITFQMIINECDVPKVKIKNKTPVEIYEMLIEGKYSSIDEYFDEYTNDQELNGLLQPTYDAYEKMLNTFANELIEGIQKTSISFEEEDGCYIVLEIKSENDKISEEFLKYYMDRTKSRYSEKIKRSLIYNFIENGIEFFRAEIDFDNIEIDVEEIGE